MAITNKLDEVHTNFLSPHDPPSQSESTHVTILKYEYIKKTWTMYLERKDNFMDISSQD